MTFTTILASFICCCNPLTTYHETAQSEFSWTHTIVAENSIHIELATTEKNAPFKAIQKMYQMDEKDLLDELVSSVFWCIYRDEQPIGAIQLDKYSSLDELKIQVSDESLANELYSNGRFLELSYALDEPYRGQGLGSIAVKAWVNDARQNAWGKHTFAIVDKENIPSQKIMEKNHLTYIGDYFHNKVKQDINVYILEYTE